MRLAAADSVNFFITILLARLKKRSELPLKPLIESAAEIPDDAFLPFKKKWINQQMFFITCPCFARETGLGE